MHIQYGQKLNNYAVQVKRQKDQIDRLNGRLSEASLGKERDITQIANESKRRILEMQSDHEERIGDIERQFESEKGRIKDESEA